MRKTNARFLCFPHFPKTMLFLFTAWLLLLTGPLMAFQQQDRVIKGKVTDENNAPIAQVSITLQGTPKTVVTDANGNFEITVTGPKAVLQFTSIGYVAREFTVTNHTSINVVLSQQSKQL